MFKLMAASQADPGSKASDMIGRGVEAWYVADLDVGQENSIKTKYSLDDCGVGLQRWGWIAGRSSNVCQVGCAWGERGDVCHGPKPEQGFCNTADEAKRGRGTVGGGAGELFGTCGENRYALFAADH